MHLSLSYIRFLILEPYSKIEANSILLHFTLYVAIKFCETDWESRQHDKIICIKDNEGNGRGMEIS